MSTQDDQRNPNALETLATAQAAWSEIASLRPLIDYLRRNDDGQVRADALVAADELTLLAERIRSLFATPTTVEDTPDQGELQQQIEALQHSVDELSAANRDLQAQLDITRTESADQVRTLTAERDQANEQLKSAKAENRELSESLGELQAEHRKLQAKSDSYASALVERDAAPPGLETEIAEAEAQFSVAGVIEMAREKHGRVVIPDAALKEIDMLDADEKSEDWARELWKAFSALNAYADESEHFNGGFWEWCEHSNSVHNLWPATSKKLAMSESDTVKNDARLWRQRRFVIDTAVSPNGYQHMEAHLKIAEGGGQHIPRLYFHDDAKGRTKNIHIGFIGPHRLVPTSQS